MKTAFYDPSLAQYNLGIFRYRKTRYSNLRPGYYDTESEVALQFLFNGKTRFMKIDDHWLEKTQTSFNFRREEFCLLLRNESQLRSEPLTISNTNIKEEASTHHGNRWNVTMISSNIKDLGLPLQDCEGRFYVFTFLPCPVTITRTTQLSQSGLFLYTCSNGNIVHYTLTCDGKNDCNDNSDETLCIISQRAKYEQRKSRKVGVS